MDWNWQWEAGSLQIWGELVYSLRSHKPTCQHLMIWKYERGRFNRAVGPYCSVPKPKARGREGQIMRGGGAIPLSLAGSGGPPPGNLKSLVQSKSVEEKERTLGAFPGNTRQTRAIWRTASTEKMASRSQGSFCSAIHCQNSRKKCPQMSFFRFPKDAER